MSFNLKIKLRIYFEVLSKFVKIYSNLLLFFTSTKTTIMKMRIIFFLCMLSTISVCAQIISRVSIDGTINAPIGDDVEGVVIYNTSTNKGTITDAEGNFQIIAGINDKLEIVAMQYQKFVIVIDKGIVQNKRLNVFLNESVNVLDEVVVTPYDLLGNVKVDVQKINVKEANISEVADVSAAQINVADYQWTPDEYSPVESNIPMVNSMKYGLNFVNLFKAVINSKKEAKKKEIDVAIREVYDDQFFKTNLNLELNEINDFIFFAEENGLDSSYLKKGREMDLIQFLIIQSKRYKKQ